MFTLRMPFACLVSWMALSMAGSGVARADPFYAHKTINFVIGLAPGGSSDLDCLLLAQYMPRHIAGNPTIVVKHMPSNGSIIALNYVGRDAKNDGLNLFCGAYDLGNALSRNPALEVDLGKFNYVLGNGDTQIFYVRSDVAPGMKTPTDLFRAQGLVLGGIATDSAKDLGERLSLEVLGISGYKYVTGFPGGGALRAAIQQNFINIYQETTETGLQGNMPAMVGNGVLVPLFVSGLPDANGQLTERDPRVNIPTLAEFYQAKFGKPPSGAAWDLSSMMLGIADTALTALMLAPGAPQDAIDAMRDAVTPLNQDPDFVQAADRTRGPGKLEYTGDFVSAQVNSFLTMRQELKDKFFATIKQDKALAEQSNK